MDVDIGIIYTHERQFMTPLVSSLAQSGDGVKMRLILVDNASLDGVNEWRPHFGDTLVVKNETRLGYAANLNAGDSFLDITNTGATVASGVSQNLCVNLYTFDPAEELIACCTCSVTPNGLQSLSALNSLISNPLTPAIPSAIVVKVVATSGASCDAAAVTGASVAQGLLVWGTTLHQNSSTAAPTYSVTETPFRHAALSEAELTHITSTCGFIKSNGSKFGICGGCAGGGLGASQSSQ